MRAIFALLTCLSMLHLTLAGGRVACASHATTATTATTAMTAMGAMPGMAMGAMSHAGAEPVKDCASRTQADCCEAMSSCDLTMTAAVAHRDLALASPIVALPSLVTLLIDSAPVAPELPPPRA